MISLYIAKFFLVDLLVDIFYFPLNLILAFSSSIIENIKKDSKKSLFLLVTTEGYLFDNQIKISIKY